MITNIYKNKKGHGFSCDCTCAYCGKEFRTSYKLATCKNQKHHFCNRKCTGKWRSKETRGSKNNRWKGGISRNHGYVDILLPDHPYSRKDGYVAEHRLVMEEHLGRYLKPEEVVHYIDGDITNNSIENLMLFKTAGWHRAHHRKLEKEFNVA